MGRYDIGLSRGQWYKLLAWDGIVIDSGKWGKLLALDGLGV